VVTSLFSLGDIVAPLLAFLLVREHLHVIQYVGFFIIILSSVLLTIDVKKIKLNRALFLMLFVSIILTLQTVLWKYLFEQGTGWGTAIIWKTLAEFLIAGLFIFIPKNYKDLKDSYKKAKAIGWIFILDQLLGWGGEVVGLYGVLILPVTVTKGIGSIQPLFVLLLTFIFARKIPRVFRESATRGAVWKKALLFIVMSIGIVLTVK
jgi:drug/metabolite transporter (DMT)-like permease